jgi:hypothetical protein
MKLLEVINVSSDVTTDEIFCIRQIQEKNGSAMRQYISYS